MSASEEIEQQESPTIDNNITTTDINLDNITTTAVLPEVSRYRSSICLVIHNYEISQLKIRIYLYNFKEVVFILLYRILNTVNLYGKH
jgi:hypothetical protein